MNTSSSPSFPKTPECETNNTFKLDEDLKEQIKKIEILLKSSQNENECYKKLVILQSVIYIYIYIYIYIFY